MHSFCIVFFRLHVWQGVLSAPSDAVARDHRDTLYVAVWNECKDSIYVEANYLRPFLPTEFRNVVPLLQLRSLLR